MHKANFIANIIKRNWFQEKPDEGNQKWTFDEDVKGLNNSQLTELICLLFECLQTRVTETEFKNIITSLQNNETYRLEDFVGKDILINNDFLVKFLKCITLSEFRINDILLYPKEMRHKRLREISDEIGLEQNMLIKIDSGWHSGAREKIFS